jgi:hypothetical protein
MDALKRMTECPSNHIDSFETVFQIFKKGDFAAVSGPSGTRIRQRAATFLPITASQVSVRRHRHAIQALNFGRLEGDSKPTEGGTQSRIRE